MKNTCYAQSKKATKFFTTAKTQNCDIRNPNSSPSGGVATVSSKYSPT